MYCLVAFNRHSRQRQTANPNPTMPVWNNLPVVQKFKTTYIKVEFHISLLFFKNIVTLQLFHVKPK